MHITFNFPCTITTAPNLESIAVDDVLLNEIKKIITSSQLAGVKVCFQYDTTFNLTDFYVSILNMIHPMLLNDKNVSPPFPVFYYYHEKKFKETHETFWYYFKSRMGKLIDNIFIITDCEDAIRSAIKNCLSEYNLSLYRCWKHLWSAIEAWIRSRFTFRLFII